ncbi:hypothetical protein FKP32DRAFT_656804 [Trametes sanguinea]|nr:hypothetical protein FKP32DRAFT_656804 [Trametes sanguinea]
MWGRKVSKKMVRRSPRIAGWPQWDSPGGLLPLVIATECQRPLLSAASHPCALRHPRAIFRLILVHPLDGQRPLHVVYQVLAIASLYSGYLLHPMSCCCAYACSVTSPLFSQPAASRDSPGTLQPTHQFLGSSRCAFTSVDLCYQLFFAASA